jgi:hypothetical protein
MKITKFLFLFFLSFLAFNFTACTNEEAPADEATEETTDDSFSEVQRKSWEAALDQYHTAMSESFHSAEEDNLEPLKQRYPQLAAVSKSWVKLPIPPEHNNEKVRKALQELEKESAAIAQVVENGTEKEMKDAIYALHDVFHKVQELCMDH